MKYIKYGLLLSILFLTGCGRSSDEFVMVTEAGFAPYEYYEGDEIVGVDIDIAKEIAQELGKKLVIKDVYFDSIINELKSGKADLGACGMSITEERLKEVDFSIEYAVSKQVVIVRNDSTLSLDDINGKRVSVQLGSVADQVLSKAYQVELIRQKKYLAALMDVQNNKADCLVMDELPAKELVKANDGVKILDGYLFIDKYGMAVKKGNTELLEVVNNVLTRLIAENKIVEYTLNHSK